MYTYAINEEEVMNLKESKEGQHKEGEGAWYNYNLKNKK